MRIGFFGLPLGALLLGHDGHAIQWAILSPVAAPGRRRLTRSLGESRVAFAAAPLRDELEEKMEALLRADPVDLVVSWFWTRRLPPSVLSAPPLGAIGVHPSLLPRHRGPNPFFWAIDSGDRRTGATVHRLEREYDTGEIIAQQSMEIGERNSWQLARALDRVGLRVLRDVLKRGPQDLVRSAREQDPRAATWAPEPSGDLLRVDWNWSVERIIRRVRALSPVPGLALSFRGCDFFVTALAREESYPRVLMPGEGTLTTEHSPRLVVRAGDGAVVVTRAMIENNESDPRNISGSRLGSILAQLPP